MPLVNSNIAILYSALILMGFGLVYHLINFAHKKRWTRVFTKAFDKIERLFGFKKVRRHCFPNA